VAEKVMRFIDKISRLTTFPVKMKGVSTKLLVIVVLALGLGIYFAMPDGDGQRQASENDQREEKSKLRSARGPTEAVEEARLKRRLSQRERDEVQERMKQEIAAKVDEEFKNLQKELGGVDLT
jgi:hypothetical protein